MSSAKLHEKIFKVAAGKTLRSLNAKETHVQTRDVYKIVMNEEFVFSN